MTPQEFTRDYFLCIHVMAYENAECVITLLSSLLPLGWEEDVCIVVGDNSDKTTAVREAVAYTSFKLGRERILYHHYPANTGIIGGILKPFEICKSTYLWIVGACNTFLPGAVDTLVPLLQESPDVLMHHESNLHRSYDVLEPTTYTDVLTLIRHHSHSIACSINSMVYNVAKMIPLLPVGYEAASCLAPHTAMVYEGLRTGKLTVQFQPVKIFERHVRPRIHWSMKAFLARMNDTFPIDVPQEYRDTFFRELPITDRWAFPDLDGKP